VSRACPPIFFKHYYSPQLGAASAMAKPTDRLVNELENHLREIDRIADRVQDDDLDVSRCEALAVLREEVQVARNEIHEWQVGRLRVT